MSLNIILASTSPRRKELLSELIQDFKIIPSPGEEIHCHKTPLPELCCMNAQSKASAIAGRPEHQNSIVIGADTLVYIDNTPLGKPSDRKEAIATLKKLSGRTHQVCTGVCIIQNEQRNDRFRNIWKLLKRSWIPTQIYKKKTHSIRNRMPT